MNDEITNTANLGPTDVAGESISIWARIARVFTSPSRAFQGMTNKWDWVIAGCVAATLWIGIFQLQKPFLMPDLERAIMENMEKMKSQMPADSYDEVVRRTQEGFEEGKKFTIKGVVTAYFATFVFIVIIAAVALMCGNFFYGGKAPYWQLLTVVAVAGFIGLLGDAARALLMNLKGSSYVYIGLGILKPTNDSSFLYYLLRQLEFSTMWKLAVICIGCGVTYRMSAARFAYVLTPLWLLFVTLIAAANLFTGGSIVY